MRMPESRGFLIPIGGAEDKLEERLIHRRFIAFAGGSNSTIVVIPSASDKPCAGSDYKEMFSGLGAAQVKVLPIFHREECDNPAHARALKHASGIFISGGEPFRLSAILADTSIARAIARLNSSGIPVAGTSAGATFMAKFMIERGESNCGPRAANTVISLGLELSSAVIIDQHFSERHRLGRLLSAVARAACPIGIGLDENTAAIIGPDNIFEVLGSGSVTVIDTTAMSKTALSGITESDSLKPAGIKIDVLSEGDRYTPGEMRH